MAPADQGEQACQQHPDWCSAGISESEFSDFAPRVMRIPSGAASALGNKLAGQKNSTPVPARITMPKATTGVKRPRDTNQLAKLMVDILTGEVSDRWPTQTSSASLMASPQHALLNLSAPAALQCATAGHNPRDIKRGQFGYSRSMPSSHEAALKPPSARPGF